MDRPRWTISLVLAFVLGSSAVRAAADATGDVPKTVTYLCNPTTEIAVTYILGDPGAARVKLKEQTWNLPHVVSASGARYSDGSVAFWNKGRDAMFEAPGTTLNCTEK